MFTIRRLKIALVLCIFVFISLGLFSISEDIKDRKNSQNIISAAKSFGVETTFHQKFVNELIRDTKLDQNSKVKIFLGPYYLLFGSDGRLVSDPPNYYILIDFYHFLLLNQDEVKALIAHEFGHAVYEVSFRDKLQSRILYQTDRLLLWMMIDSRFFIERNYAILTKYQIKADEFSAKKTSPEAMISLLDKLYIVGRESPDYKMRMESLNKLKQER